MASTKSRRREAIRPVLGSRIAAIIVWAHSPGPATATGKEMVARVTVVRCTAKDSDAVAVAVALPLDEKDCGAAEPVLVVVSEREPVAVNEEEADAVALAGDAVADGASDDERVGDGLAELPREAVPEPVRVAEPLTDPAMRKAQGTTKKNEAAGHFVREPAA